MNNNIINHVICADIGGSHITAAVIDLSDRTMVEGSFVRIEVNLRGTWADIIGVWVEALKKANTLVGSGVHYVSLAMPGPFDYEHGVSYIRGLNKYDALYGLNIRYLLAEEIGVEPEHIRFRNDAEATIAGEALAGAGQDHKNMMGVTLGTGFGSAQFMDGESKDLNLGSESFKESIADDYLSTRWFLKQHYEQTGISLTDGVKELADIAKNRNSAKDLFKEFAVNLSNFLSVPVDQLKLDVLILCGNIAKASPFFLNALKKRLNINIKLATLGEQAALIGAAALFQTDDINQPIT